MDVSENNIAPLSILHPEADSIREKENKLYVCVSGGKRR